MQPLLNFQKFCSSLVWIEGKIPPKLSPSITYLEKLGFIHWFEFTHELAWNTLKDLLASRGNTELIYGSRDATREAFAAGLIENGECWMEMILDRNRSSHTYDPQTAEAVYQAATKRYHPEFLALQKKLTEII